MGADLGRDRRDSERDGIPVGGLDDGAELVTDGGEMAANSVIDDQIPQPNATNATDQMPQNPSPNATTFGEQMPQNWQASNATNATIVNPTNTEFAQPSGWGKLWRLERNGDYCNWRLRFTDNAETPKEFKRLTRPGGKITSRIEAKFAKRKGKGRHAESRTDAERFRGRALDLAKRIRSVSGSGRTGETSPNATIHDPEYRDSRGAQMPQMRSLDNPDELSGLWKSDRVM